MNPQSIRNVIIIVVVAAAIIVGGAYFYKQKNEPKEMKKQKSFDSFNDWYSKNLKTIEDGNAGQALSEIEGRIARFEGNPDPGIKLPLYELKGMALLKLNRCDESVESLEAALRYLETTVFAWIPERSDEPMTDKEKADIRAKLQGLLNQAKACSGG